MTVPAASRDAIFAIYRRLATPWVLVSALVTVSVITVLFQITGRMVVDGGTTGIELQRAFTPDRFASVVRTWGDGVEAFKSSLIMLDFAFPLAYACALASLAALAGGPGPERPALALFALPWAAAALDWIENLLHLWLLADVHTAADAAAAAYPALLVAAASVAAMFKFALLLATASGAALLAVRRRSWSTAAVGAALLASFAAALWV
jgi:hypothetical protein